MSEIRDFKLSEISDLIILAFYELYKSGFYEGNRIEPKLDFEPIASAYEAEKAIELLISKRLLVKKEKISFPELSGKGIDYVERNFEDEESFIQRAQLSLTPFVEERISNTISIKTGEEDSVFEMVDTYFGAKRNDNSELLQDFLVPASNRYVSLDHNNQSYIEAIETIDIIIQEFREDHCLDNDLGHEKGALLKALEGGRELLNDTEVNVRIATALLIEPLKRITEKFGEKVEKNKNKIIPVATAAIAAMEAIRLLLGL